MNSRIFVAIDTPDLDRAKALAKAVKRHAGGIKLGLEFFAANGPSGVSELAKTACRSSSISSCTTFPTRWRKRSKPCGHSSPPS